MQITYKTVREIIDRKGTIIERDITKKQKKGAAAVMATLKCGRPSSTRYYEMAVS